MISTQLLECLELLLIRDGESHCLVVKLNCLRDRKAPAGLCPGPDEKLESLAPDRLTLDVIPGQVRLFAGDGSAVVIREQLRKLFGAVARERFDPRADLRVGFGAPRFGE